MRKLERLLNLIALLLNTRRPLTVDDIRNTVPGYGQEDYSSFKRMFERDKEELRALGIPIERRFTDVWEVEEGYLIPNDRYYLPDLDLTADEVAALWLASHVVVEEGAKEDQALLKLTLGTNTSSDPSSPLWMRARLDLDKAPTLPELLEAVAGRRSVRFEYKAADRAKPSERTVDPYSLVHRAGSWYLVGHDQMRGDLRHFKLQRITSSVSFAKKSPGPDFDVPEDFDSQREATMPTSQEIVEGRLGSQPWDEQGTEVEIAISPRIAWTVEQSLGVEASGEVRVRGADDATAWPAYNLSITDEDGFLSWMLGFGVDAVLRSPARLRNALIERLEGLGHEPAGQSR